MTLLGKMTSVAGDLKDLGVEKIKATVEELNTTLPYVREVGYSVTRISLEMALTPKIVVSLAKVFEVEDTRFASILEELGQYKVFCTVLGALRQVNNLQAKIRFQGRCLKEVEIELGLPPGVKMVFLEGELPSSSPPVTGSGETPTTKGMALPMSPVFDSSETEAWPATEIPPRPHENEPALDGLTAVQENEPPRQGPSTLAFSPVFPAAPPSLLPASPREQGPASLPEKTAPPPELEEADSLPLLETPPGAPVKAAPSGPAPSMIHFRCFGCNHRVRVAAKAAGKLARCKKCGTVLKIPPTPEGGR
jgi:hypothetical protein